MRGDQQDATAVSPPEARLEKVDKRHMNLAQRDGFNLHNL
jgi:hypothetical protein